MISTEKQLTVNEHKIQVCQEAIKMLKQVNNSIFRDVEQCTFRENQYSCSLACEYWNYCSVRLWYGKRRNAVNNLIADLNDQIAWHNREIQNIKIEKQDAIEW